MAIFNSYVSHYQRVSDQWWTIRFPDRAPLGAARLTTAQSLPGALDLADLGRWTVVQGKICRTSYFLINIMIYGYMYIYIYIMCMYIYINHYKPLWFFCLQTPLEGCARVECLGLPRQHPHKDHRINRCAGLHLPIISLGKEGTVHLYTSWISLISMDGWMDG